MSPRPSRSRWRVVLLAAGLSLLAVAAFFYYRLEHPPGAARATEDVVVDIPRGTSTAEIFRRLEAAGVVEDARLAEVYYRLHRRRTTLQAGEYRFRRPMPIDEIINRMGRGDVVRHFVVVPEGLTAEETFALFWKQGIGGPDGFRAAMAETELVPGLSTGVTDLEGFLFPDTYEVTRSTSAKEIVDRMVANFRRHFTPALQRRAAALGLSVRQAVALASIVQKETSIRDEAPLVAGVYWNRLKRGMRLQADPTVIYAMKRDGRWTGTLYRSDYDYDSPYNTYRIDGLPPGPICNPGMDALKAAVNPARTAFLYFVADPLTGRHNFSTTFDEHLYAIALARQARAAAGLAGEPAGPPAPAVTETPTPGVPLAEKKVTGNPVPAPLPN
ncbi:MAG TPA: endolytic transglycosylase MltG [Thermoanaerobaculia bacterium]|nr:endolytic transglycosylase MltG [Thermoanaerobaculia bacterium]